MNDRLRQRVGALLLLGLVAGSLLAGLHTGSYELTTAEIVDILLGNEHPQTRVVLELRLPRSLLAILVGAILSLGGFFMQALIKNPLADPYIMGLTSGAGLGVNLVILGIIPMVGLTAWTFPIAAALGGMASLTLLAVLGFRAMYEDNARLLIAGVAVASIGTALTGILIYRFADTDQVRQMVFWAFGSLGRADWQAVGVSSLLLLIGLGVGWWQGRRLDVLVMGDTQAMSLGLSVTRFKWLLLVLCSIVVGGSVAFTGPIGFVGMMIPHFTRALFGGNHRVNLILGALLGGSYLCWCDLLTRWVLPPAGVPIGIITAILGVPFFLYLLYSPRSQL
ncbi:MAG: iron ABC transporter permease [Bacteroidota bacterium]